MKFDEAMKKFNSLKKTANKQKSIWDEDVTVAVLEQMTKEEKELIFYDYGRGDF